MLSAGNSGILADQDRWEPTDRTKALHDLPDEEESLRRYPTLVSPLSNVPAAVLEWATGYNGAIFKRSYNIDIEWCMYFKETSKLEVGDIVYIVPEKNYSLSSMVSMHVQKVSETVGAGADADTTSAELILEFVKPLAIMPSIQVFADQHAKVTGLAGRRTWKLFRQALNWSADPDLIWATIGYKENQKRRQPLIVLTEQGLPRPKKRAARRPPASAASASAAPAPAAPIADGAPGSAAPVDHVDGEAGPEPASTAPVDHAEADPEPAAEGDSDDESDEAWVEAVGDALHLDVHVLMAEGVDEAREMEEEWVRDDERELEELMIKSHEDRLLDDSKEAAASTTVSVPDAAASSAISREPFAGCEADPDPAMLEEDALERILASHGADFSDDEDDDGNDSLFGDTAVGIDEVGGAMGAAPPVDDDRCLASLVADERAVGLMCTWQREALLGLQILESRQHSIDVRIGRTEYPPWEASLLAFDCHTSDGLTRPCVEFVFWTFTKAKKGRILTVEAQEPHYMHWPTAGSHPEVSFVNAEVVHPAIGVIAKRVASKGPLSDTRSIVHPHVMRLRSMWEVAQAARSGDSSLQPCALCHSIDGVVTTCAVCLLSMHHACRQIVSSVRKDDPCELQQLIGKCSKPALFVAPERTSTAKEPMCLMCETLFSEEFPRFDV